MKKLLYLLLLIYFSKLYSTTYSLNTGMLFLDLIAPPRSSSMGGAYGSVSDDAETIYYNPAGLGFLNLTEFYLTYGNYFREFSSLNVLCSYSLKSYGTFAFSGGYFYMSEIDKYDINGNKIMDGIRMYDAFFTSSFGVMVMRGLSLGVGTKYLYENIANTAGSIIAFDYGLIYSDLFIENLYTGLSFINFSGMNLKLGKNEEKLPSKIKFSISYIFKNLLTDLDINITNGRKIVFNSGCEYLFDKILYKTKVYLRTGLSILSSYDFISGISLGIGVVYSTYRIDFSIKPHTDLGITYKFLLGTRF